MIMSDLTICPGHRDRSCGTRTEDNDLALECDVCAYWHHIKCQHLSTDAYQAIAKFNLFWVCDSCRIKCLQINAVSSIYEKLEHLETKFDKLADNISTGHNVIEKTYAEAARSYSKINKTFQQITETSIKNNPTPDQVSSSQPSTHLSPTQAYHSVRDWNAVIYNLPEKEDELENCTNLFRNNCDTIVDKSEIESVRRLGTIQNPNVHSKARPLLVSFKRIETKSKVMSKSYSEKNKAAKIFINHDRSKQERDLLKSKIIERNDLIKNDTSGEWFYRITGPPWAMAILKEPRKKKPSLTATSGSLNGSTSTQANC